MQHQSKVYNNCIRAAQVGEFLIAITIMDVTIT